MPLSKISFKENHLIVEIEGAEFTFGSETVKVARFKGSLDVNDFLHSPLPSLGNGSGIRLINMGKKKIQIIKEVRNATGLGLKEAKILVEGSEHHPVFISTQAFRSSFTPEGFVSRLKSHGATVEVVHSEGETPKVLHVLQKWLTSKLGEIVNG